MLADLSDLNAAVGGISPPFHLSQGRLLPDASSMFLKSSSLIHSKQQETQAANALVNANKTLGPAPPPADSAKQPEQPAGRPGLRNHKRTGSGGSAASTGSSFMSRTASPAKFDKYGRRILTPPNTRANSAYGSIPGTPRRDPEVSRRPGPSGFPISSVTSSLVPATAHGFGRGFHTKQAMH